MAVVLVVSVHLLAAHFHQSHKSHRAAWCSVSLNPLGVRQHDESLCFDIPDKPTCKDMQKVLAWKTPIHRCSGGGAKKQSRQKLEFEGKENQAGSVHEEHDVWLVNPDTAGFHLFPFSSFARRTF